MDGYSVDKHDFAYPAMIQEICDLGWTALDRDGVIDAAWAYYFFSVQFQENLEVARKLFPDDEKLQDLEREEAQTDNLSPWPNVAAEGERMNHCEFMRRVLALAPIPEAKRRQFIESGERYLSAVRATPDLTRALSIASYEDGGLESVFGAMLKSAPAEHPVVEGFRYFLFAHIQFDSDPTKGHGAMIRHLRPDDRILPLWTAFRDILVAFAPGLAVAQRQGGTAKAASAA